MLQSKFLKVLWTYTRRKIQDTQIRYFKFEFKVLLKEFDVFTRCEVLSPLLTAVFRQKIWEFVFDYPSKAELELSLF
jgi:hypothetical protein